jgi:hypothetical protein
MCGQKKCMSVKLIIWFSITALASARRAGVLGTKLLQRKELELDKSEWNDSETVLLSELITIASGAPQYFSLQKVSAAGVQHISGGKSDWHWDCFVQRVLPAVSKRLPVGQPPIFLLINSYDEPVSRLEKTCHPRVLEVHGNIFGWRSRVSPQLANKVPFFSPCKVRGCHKDWLYPYGEICDAYAVKLSRDIPWEKRESSLFWRGTTTGYGSTRRALLETKNHRVRVVRALRQLSHTRPDLSIDVGFTDFLQNIQRIEELAAPWVNFEKWNEKRYILDIGGNSYSRRLVQLAHLRSALILSNPFQDLFSRTLINGTHVFVSDLLGDDIVLLYEKLLNDSDSGMRMGRSLERHMRRNFDFESVVRQMTSILQAYAEVVTISDDTADTYVAEVDDTVSPPCVIQEADIPPWMRTFSNKSPTTSSYRVAFVTLTRDSCEKLKRNICQVNGLIQHIADAKVFVLEDNSKDCTLDVLNEWASTAQVEVVSLRDGVMPAGALGDRHPSRFARMAFLRSTIMERVVAWMPDVTVVYDSDLTRGYADWAIVDAVNAVGSGIYTAVCANDVMPTLQWRHYDSLALRFEWKQHVDNNMLFNATGSNFDSNRVKVRSCFGGLAIYHASVFNSCKYPVDPETEWDCEHVLLSKCLEKEGRDVYLLPNMAIVVPYGSAP